MPTVLGIDAAWTAKEPSGVALIRKCGRTWEAIAVAPSYAAFVASAAGTGTNWSTSAAGSAPDVDALLGAARKLSGEDVCIVAIDMPIATVPFCQRRSADQAVSKAYGARGCSAHSPGIQRPGPLGAELSSRFAELGYPIATAQTLPGAPQHLLEVYPHPALLTLLNRTYRVPYKVSKSGKYWKGTTIAARVASLLLEFAVILAAVRTRIEGVDLTLPSPDSVTTLAELKRFEDALDALVCCWVGASYLAGHARPLGDHTSAIWCPN